jgi:Fe-S cluster assembly protein SufD
MSEVAVETKFSMQVANEGQGFLMPEKMRQQAEHVLATTDFPTTRTEAWKYTRVAKIKNGSFHVSKYATPSTIDISAYLIPNVKGSVLVFVNGFFASELSTILPETGLELVSLAQNSNFFPSLGEGIVLENEVFSSINTVYAQDGLGVRVLKKHQVEQQIQVVYLTTGSGVYSGCRNYISCEDFASAHLILNYVSLNDEVSFTNQITEIHVGANANLKIDKIQNQANTAFSIITEQVNQQKDSTFTINTLTVDGALIRNNLHIDVNGQNCETNLSGAYILKGKQHVDNHTIVDHKVAHCQSNELYKGVIDDQATAVFNGKVFVRKDAQKINAFQSNGNVLLSESATINSKPELEIYADDVKCSHGSTTGQLDEEAVFYLRARGLSEKSARALMVTAFVGDALDKIESEDVRNYVDGLLLDKFGWEL